MFAIRQLDEDLCEFIGAYIGDGFCNRYGNINIIQFTGDANLDKEYMRYLSSVAKKHFPECRPAFRQHENTLRLTIYSKELLVFLTKYLGLLSGKKSHDILIPSKILNERISLVNACLRGIFDTDGGIYFDKRSIYKEPYMRIELHMRNPGLLCQIANILLKQDVKAKLCDQKERIQINGKNCARYLSAIGFSNPRHRKKIDQLSIYKLSRKD